MSFALCSKISIKNYSSVKPHEVKITKSIFEFVDKATIKLPISARIKRKDVVVTEKTETANQFGEGDLVTIQLGYDGVYTSEFEGFVSRINFTQPLEVECEGYSYQLRQKTITQTFKNVDLKDILKAVISGTDIKLNMLFDSLPVVKLKLEGQNGVEALQKITKELENVVKFYFSGKTLNVIAGYMAIRNDENGKELIVKYRLGWNVIKDNNLKQRVAKNQQVTVVISASKDDGTIVSGSYGKGEIKRYKVTAVKDQETLKRLAEAKQKQISFDGYEGKITAFGIPYCEPGYKCVLDDKKYPERSGNYIVESTEVVYGMSGYRRTVGIGAKL